MKFRYYITITLILFLFSTLLYAKKKNFFGPWDSKIIKKEHKLDLKKLYQPSTASWSMNRFIRIFQLYITPQDGPNCRYSPTCSQYGLICINRYGLFMGIIMSADRYLRCNPVGAWGYDHPEDNYFLDNKNKKDDK